MDVLPAHLNKDSFRDSFKGLVALEIRIDLPIGFPINNIIFLLEKRRSDSAQAHSDPEAARRLLERHEKEVRDFDFSFGTFRKNIECQDPGDLRTRMDEGQKWVQEHFAPWAKSFLETRPRHRWKEMTDTTN